MCVGAPGTSLARRILVYTSTAVSLSMPSYVYKRGKSHLGATTPICALLISQIRRHDLSFATLPYHSGSSFLRWRLETCLLQHFPGLFVCSSLRAMAFAEGVVVGDTL